MTTIYVKEQGAQVGRSGERLVVRKDGNVVDSFPLQQVEQVVLMGNVQLTTQATATLLAQDIDVVFLSSFGTFRGRLTGQGNSNARLRQQQLQRMSDEAFALQLARSVVRVRSITSVLFCCTSANGWRSYPAGACATSPATVNLTRRWRA